MEIIWTKRAFNSFEKNVDYLLINWNEKQASAFINETFRTLEIIRKNPYVGKYNCDFLNSVILITKQISLFYEIKNDTIILKNFWDNRKKPISKLKS